MSHQITKFVCSHTKLLAAGGHFLTSGSGLLGNFGNIANREGDLLCVAGLLDGRFGNLGDFSSSGFDEFKIQAALAAGAAIDAFGVGTKMGVSADRPFLEMVYKLVCLDGRPIRKLSNGKVTLAGVKQVYRPALPTDSGPSLRCVTWFNTENAYPPVGRDNDGSVRDWLGVRVIFDHDWKTGIFWFNGSARWQDDTIMRLEPDPD